MQRPNPRFRFATALLGLVLLFAGPAGLATPLDDAKAAGDVGEQADGYLGIVSPPASAAVQALVADINTRRRDQYRAIASRNGIDLEAVEVLAGQKAMEKTPAGQFIRPAGGAWRRK
jgi:uncharacterized protein YdbL (DUF1318 family)